MKLTELVIHRFGGLTNRRVGPFGDGLNVVFGPNEAGKTTLFRYVRGTLHGFTAAHNEGLLASDSGTRSPGWLELRANDATIRVERRPDGRAGRLTAEPPLARPRSIEEPLAFFEPYESDTTATLVAAALEHGIDLQATSWPTGELDELRSRLERRCGELVGSLRDVLARQRSWAARIEEIAAIERRRSTEFDARRRSLVAAREELRDAIGASRSERQRIETELAALRARRESEAQDRCRRASETARRIDERLRTIAEIDERIARARLVLGDLDLRGAELQQDVDRRRTISGPPGDATLAVHQLEAEVERLTAHRANCRHCGGGHETSCCDGVRSASETLRERVYRLCELVGRHAVEARAIAAREELRELDGCRTGLRTQLETLAARRSRETEALESAGAFRLLAPASAAAEFCRCERHRDTLAELRERLTGLARAERLDSPVESTHSGLDREIGALERRLSELVARFARDEESLASLERELVDLAPPTVSQDDEAARLRVDLEFARIDFRRDAERYRVIRRQLGITHELGARRDLGCESVVAAEASAHLRRMTLGHCPELRVSRERRLEVRTASRGWTLHDSLGAGTRHLVGLAFRLAVASELRRRGTHVPLFLDDVLVDNDLDRQRAAVEILAEQAADGQQIVLLTCHLHLREACRGHGSRVLELPPRREPERPGDERGGTDRSRSRIAETTPRPRPPIKPIPIQPTAAARPLAFVSPTEPLVPLRRGDRADETFALHLADDLRRISPLSKRHVRVLGLGGVHTVGELLELDLDSEFAARLFARHAVHREEILRSQSQARLLATIPDLHPLDAAVLAEIDVHDAACLQSLSEIEFTDRLRRLHETNAGRGLLRSGRRFDLDWFRGLQALSRRARTFDQARASGSPRSRRNDRRRRNGGWASRSIQRSPIARTPRVDSPHNDSPRTEVPRPPDSRSEPPRVPPMLVASTTPSPAEHDRDDDRDDASDNERGLRFFLARSSPVVDAPSIGPKTATRLKRAGVVTVDDLLHADADAVAARLGSRHVTTDVIREWQCQARLVCRIPELRGHDAQILVACGIDSPEGVAAAEPRALLATVTPFCRSPAGKRILRSGKAPNLAEVTDWINWSQQCRTLKAA